MIILSPELQEGLEEPLKGDQLLGRQQVDIPFVVQQKGGDADDGPGEVAGPDYDLLKEKFAWLRATMAVTIESAIQTW